MGGNWVSVSPSDDLLLFAWNLAWLLMLSVAGLFMLICRKHYQRRRRYRAVAEIDRLLNRVTDPELFHESNTEFHRRLKQYYAHDYLDLLYAWTRKCQQLNGAEREIFCNNSTRCGLFDRIPENLKGIEAAQICIALEVCGLAAMTQYAEQVTRYTWLPTYAPFACHAMVRMNFENGMECLFRAYGHQLINNGELITICSEFSQDKISAWATQSTHWPLPEALYQYGVVV